MPATVAAVVLRRHTDYLPMDMLNPNENIITVIEELGAPDPSQISIVAQTGA